jgi:Ras-related GTP-binding protein C/D
MSPNETLFLESTSKLVKNDISNSSFVQFQVWDFPGQLDFLDSTFDSTAIFGGNGALVFVIDAQDDADEALLKLHRTIKHAHKINPTMSFEVFIHKCDGLSNDVKLEIQRDLQKRAIEDLRADGLDVNLCWHTTSIYDHTIFEAFSKVIQKLIPQLPTLESLLDSFAASCMIDKAFLVDVVSKIYIATDRAPVDMQTYELCSDMIDVVIDVSCIYGMPASGEGLAYDAGSQSVIRLNNGMILYLKEVNKYLALVAVISADRFKKSGLIDYNFACFREAIEKVFI